MSIVKTYKGHDVPEGATHHWSHIFYKLESGEWYSFDIVNRDAWGRTTNTDKECRDKLVELPQEQFVPVVGEEYEVESDSVGEYKPAFYVGVSADGSHIFDVEGKWLWRLDTAMHVRPIKTEREKVIDEAIDVMNVSQDDSQEGWAAALFDSGMLSIPENDNDQ